jgi:hypothetical protein
LIGASRALGFRAAFLPCKLAPHLGVLVTDASPEVGAVRVGRVLERVWLRAESEGLVLQPLAGAALLSLPEFREVSSSTRSILAQAWRGLVPGTPILVFRMGRAHSRRVRTGRRSASEYLA